MACPSMLITGVAGVDRHVGLDERQVVARLARLGRDDAGGDGVLQPEGRADGQHPFTHAQPVRVADGEHRQFGRVDLEQGHVGVLVRADQAGLELALVGECDVDVIGAIHHVVVGHHIAIGRDDEAGTEAPGNLLTRLTRRQLALASLPLALTGQPGHGAGRQEAAEELEERIIRVEQFCPPALLGLAGRTFGGADVDHGAPGFLDQAGEIGQTAYGLGLYRGRLQQGGGPHEQAGHGQGGSGQRGTQRTLDRGGEPCTDGPAGRLGNAHRSGNLTEGRVRRQAPGASARTSPENSLASSTPPAPHQPAPHGGRIGGAQTGKPQQTAATLQRLVQRLSGRMG